MYTLHSTALRALLLALGLASVAHAAPGDPVALRGTLAWPETLERHPFAVVRLDDGRVFYADLTSVPRQQPIAAGARVSLVGVEGGRPHEVTGVAIGAGDSVVAAPPAGPSASPPPADATRTAAPAATRIEIPAEAARPSRPEDSRTPERIAGTLHAVRDRTITIRAGDRAVEVDVSRLGAGALRGVRSGDRVVVFAVGEPDRTLTAVGFVHASGRPSAVR
jgi:hypothetical protein